MTFIHPLKRENRPPAMNSLLHMFADDAQRIILETMVLSSPEVTIQHIQERTHMKYGSIYHYLGVMESCSMIESVRDGRERYYAINQQALKQIGAWASTLVKILDNRS